MADFLGQLGIEESTSALTKPSGSILEQLGLGEAGQPVGRGGILSPLPSAPTPTEDELMTRELEGIPVGKPITPSPFVGEPLTGKPAYPIDIVEAVAHLGKGALAYIPSKAEMFERLTVGTAAGLSVEELEAEIAKSGAWAGGGPATSIAKEIEKVTAPVFEAPQKVAEFVVEHAPRVPEYGTGYERDFADLMSEQVWGKQPAPFKVSQETADKVAMWAKAILGTGLELYAFKKVHDVYQVGKKKFKSRRKPTTKELEELAGDMESTVKDALSDKQVKTEEKIAKVEAKSADERTKRDQRVLSEQLSERERLQGLKTELDKGVPKEEPTPIVEPEKPTAEFQGYMGGEAGTTPVAIYNVGKDTWSATTLREKGIDVPETPNFEEWSKPSTVEPTEPPPETAAPDPTEPVSRVGGGVRKRFDVGRDTYEMTVDGKRKVVKMTPTGMEEVPGVEPLERATPKRVEVDAPETPPKVEPASGVVKSSEEGLVPPTAEEVIPAPTPKPVKTSERIRTLYEEGKPTAEIATELELTKSVVEKAATKMELERPREVVSMSTVQEEARKIVSEAKDLDEVYRNVQELTTRYEENLDYQFADRIEEQAYRDWGDEMMGKIIKTRRDKGLEPEPDLEAPITRVNEEGVRETYIDPTDNGGFSTAKAAEIYQRLHSEVEGTVIENPTAPGQFVIKQEPSITLRSGVDPTELYKVVKEHIYKVFHSSPEGKLGKTSPELATEGFGYYGFLEKRDAEFFGRRISEHEIKLKKPLTTDEPSYMLSEDPLIEESIKPTDSDWLRINKQAFQDSNPKITSEGTFIDQALINAHITKRATDLGYDGLVFEESGAQHWVVKFDRQGALEYIKDVAEGSDVTLGFGGTEIFQKMYDNLAARIRNRAKEGKKPLPEEANKLLDRGRIVGQRKIKGRLRPPVHEAELEILKATKKLPETMFNRAFENPIRTFEEAGGEPLLDMTIHPYHAAESAIHKVQGIMKSQRKDLGKGLSHRARKRIMIHAVAQQKKGMELLEQVGVKEVPKLKPNELEAYNAMRDRYEAWYTRGNRVRKAIGQEPFPKTDDYFTFIRNFSILERAGFHPMSMTAETLNAQFIKMGATPFKFAKPRSNALYKMELDPFRVLEIYEDSMIRHIHMSPLVAKVRELLSTVVDPETGKEFNLVNENPVLHASLQAWNNNIAGLKTQSWKLPPAIEAGMMRVNNNLAAAILGANARSAMIQVSALRNTVGEIGFDYTMRGVASLLDPAKRNFALSKSKVLSQRAYDITVEDAIRGIRTGKIGEVKKVGTKIAMKPLQILDMETAKASWQGAYMFGKKKLKLSEARARTYADDVVTKTQASAMSGDVAPIQRSVAGKFLTLFQTFTINDWDFLVKDVVGVRRRGPFTKETFKKAMRYVAATTAFNILMEDGLHINSPFPTPIRAFKESLEKGDDIPSLCWNVGKEFIEPIPLIGAARYGKGPGGPGWELFNETQKYIRQDPMARQWWELGGKWFGVPGTAQTAKTVRAHKRGETPYGQVVGTYTEPLGSLTGLEGLEGLTGLP